LINQLVNDGAYVVASRSSLENYLREKQIASTIDEATAVKIGQALGVDAVIVGTVTRFNVETRRSGGSFMGIGGGSEKTKAVVQLTVRIIDTKSQSIIAAIEGMGEAESRGGHGSIAGIGSGSSSRSGTDEMLSQAADDAIVKLVSQMKTRL
jgi:curli biogenesis system outer membrane secretion channel CsgG